MDLVEHLIADDSTQLEKVTSIYSWITSNIKYDVKGVGKPNQRTKSIRRTLRTKKGICYQYSDLFNRMCQQAGLSSLAIVGYSRGLGYHEEDLFYQADHVWNGVRIDSVWYWVDTTWGSGVLKPKKQALKHLAFQWMKRPLLKPRYRFVAKQDERYFLVQPYQLLYSHLPADPVWQFSTHAVSLSDFEKASNFGHFKGRRSLAKESKVVFDELNINASSGESWYDEESAAHMLLFNPRNYRPLVYANYNKAVRNQEAYGSLAYQLTRKTEALRCFKATISYAKKHQKSATAVSNKINGEVKKLMSTKVTPHAKAMAKTNRKLMIALQHSLGKSKRQVERQQLNCEKKEKTYNEMTPSSLDLSPSRAKADTVVLNQNLKTIDVLSLEIDLIKDSLKLLAEKKVRLVRGIDKLDIEMRLDYLSSILKQTKLEIAGYVSINEIGFLLSRAKKISNQRDSVYYAEVLGRKEIRKNEKKANQLQSSILSKNSMIKRMVIENYRYSGGAVNDRAAYRKANAGIKEVYLTRWRMAEKKLALMYKTYEYQHTISKRLSSIAKLLNTTLDYIGHYETQRINDTNAKKASSHLESARLINKSQRGMSKMNVQIGHLKSELSKQKHY